MKIVVVGGVAGGASAAAKARRVNEQAEIVMFEKGPYVSFANCGLPYYIGGDIEDRGSLLLQTPASFWKRFRVRARVLHEVVRIDRAQKRVEAVDLQTGQKVVEPYDRLILAPGAGAIVPPLPGIRSPNVFTVKTVPDSDAVKAFIEKHRPARAVVIGAGFIGLEAAEVLRRRDIDVTVVEMLPQVLPPFDPDAASFVSRHLEDRGIHLVLADGLKAFHGAPLAAEIELQSGRRLPMDMAILSIGVRPELKLAKEAGLDIGAAGGIVVDDHQRTSDPDIYAAGDAVEVTHLVSGRKTRIPLAGPANKQGRVAGANAAGADLTFPGALGTAIVETMGITAAKTGLSEREAAQAGYQTNVSVTHSLSHAGYFPGGAMLHIKIVADRTDGRLLGAQIVGEEGVDKRVDVLATALAARMKVTDLENLDLAYAPQFSSAKDPVIMAGFVASNVHRDAMEVITCADLQKRIDAGGDMQILDVRTQAEYDGGHLPNAWLIPIDELRDRLGELNPDRETFVYCRVGLRGYLATRILRQNGFKRVFNLTGGILMCDGASSPPPPAPAMPANGDTAPETLRTAMGAGAKVIDIREADEFDYEHISGTTSAPMSRLQEAIGGVPKDRDIYLLCQSGIRSRQAVDTLRAWGYRNVHCVSGGLRAWKAAGFPVETRKGPIPIMRQVQIVAGSLALAGGAVPGFRWLAVVVGVGLVVAGASGTCAMATVLAKMPWNKPRTPVNPCKGPGACQT